MEKTEIIDRTDEERLQSSFLFAYLRRQPFIRQIEAIMGQTTRNQVPITAQKELFLLLPSTYEQEQIASINRATLECLVKNRLQSSKLRHIKTALMQDLLTGNKSVTALLDEREVARA